MANLNLLDIAKLNAGDAAVGLIEEAHTSHPEVRIGAARTIKGTTFSTKVRTGLPTAAFRNANEGVAASKSTYENRLVQCFILNPRWETDKAVANAYEDGPEALIALEGAGQVEASLQTLGSQMYYGTANDAKGFPGLVDVVQSSMVIDAGGTTSSTGSSVWAVRFGPADVQFVLGQDGEIEMPETYTARVTDDDNNPYTAYVSELTAHVGLMVGSVTSIGQIKDLTKDSGKGLTDALLEDLLATFPAGKQPNALFCSRRSLGQLRKSRTATNATGKEAPLPADFDGIPLYSTDSITNTETLS